jgi:Protein of unknown function (DUF3455)
MERLMKKISFVLLTGILIGESTCVVKADQAAVALPAGSRPLLEVRAEGVQVYRCESKPEGFEWKFKAVEANLFDNQGRQIGIHSDGPTWKMDDSSEVVGEVVERTSSPDPGAIQWLLLRVKSHEGLGSLSQAAFIRRTDTKGGVAPKTGCDANHLSQEARMRYSAIYQFFGAAKSSAR